MSLILLVVALAGVIVIARQWEDLPFLTIGGTFGLAFTALAVWIDYRIHGAASNLLYHFIVIASSGGLLLWQILREED